MKKLLLVALVAISGLMLVGCNTTQKAQGLRTLDCIMVLRYSGERLMNINNGRDIQFIT